MQRRIQLPHMIAVLQGRAEQARRQPGQGLLTGYGDVVDGMGQAFAPALFFHLAPAEKGARIRGRYQGAEDHTLPQQGMPAEVLLQEFFEFLAIQLLEVEFIMIARHIAVFVFVR